MVLQKAPESQFGDVAEGKSESRQRLWAASPPQIGRDAQSAACSEGVSCFSFAGAEQDAYYEIVPRGISHRAVKCHCCLNRKRLQCNCNSDVSKVK